MLTTRQVVGFESQSPCIDCNHGQVVNTCASVTKQYNLVPANGWWMVMSALWLER